MRAFAESSNGNRPRKRARRRLAAGARHQPPTIQRAPADAPVAAPQVGACACGGGCPRCRRKPTFFQAKLEVGAPGDQFEQEADRVAEQVTRSAAPRVSQRECAGGAGAPCARDATEAGQEKLRLQPAHDYKPSGVSVSDDFVRELGAGQPLDAATRAFMEPRFGRDFGHVRVHTGERAAESAREVNALAYTVGHNIVFGAGRYAPSSAAGRLLLSHELAHVVQQSVGKTPGVRIQRQSDAGTRSDAGTQPTGQQSGTAPAVPPLTHAVPCPSPWPAITVPATCLSFANQQALDQRKGVWLNLIEQARNTNTACVYEWAAGMVLPPPAVFQEVNLQRDCMLRDLTAARGQDMAPLPTGATALAGHVQGAGRHPPNPGYRDFLAQAQIWRAKFLFLEGQEPFDRITQEALDRCPTLSAPPARARVGQKWRPLRSNQEAGEALISQAHRDCWLSLPSDVRQRQILQASSAPGISRHHFGSDMDLFSVNPGDWERSGRGADRLADEYDWLHAHAAQYGFIQPYIQDARLRNINQIGYMAERWHWSYYPVAQALLDFFESSPNIRGMLLGLTIRGGHAQFTAEHRAELRRGRGQLNPFSFADRYWEYYVTNVARQGSF